MSKDWHGNDRRCVTSTARYRAAGRSAGVRGPQILERRTGRSSPADGSSTPTVMTLLHVAHSNDDLTFVASPCPCEFGTALIVPLQRGQADALTTCPSSSRMNCARSAMVRALRMCRLARRPTTRAWRDASGQGLAYSAAQADKDCKTRPSRLASQNGGFEKPCAGRAHSVPI